MKPRAWQAAFDARHRTHARKDFLLVATPGAGKTLAACEAIRAAGVTQVVVVCPTTALRSQWADAADLVGLHLDPRWRNADGAWRSDVDGVAVTYQQVASAPDLFAHHLARPTFVVLDEIHHAGESASWGTALRTAFEGAAYRLALSGTPFRSDARAIPFVRYDDERRCAPDFVYGYADAVNDRVCRPLAFRLLDATLRWRVDAQERIAAFADELDATDDARRLRTAIDPSTPLLPQLLRDADALLVKARAVIPDAAGLLLCDDRAHARASAALLRTIAGEKPVVVVSDEAGAHARIDRFARGGGDDPRWLVAVNMVSEGVDVPRLVLAAYATVSAPTSSSARRSGASSGAGPPIRTTWSRPSSCPPTRRWSPAPSASRSSCASRSSTTSAPHTTWSRRQGSRGDRTSSRSTRTSSRGG